MKNWSPLHHLVWRSLREAHLHKTQQSSRRTFLICVSGGADSMALLHIVRALPISICVFHAHHGPTAGSNYRDRARDFVHQFCLQHKISFLEVRTDHELRSENEMRKFRRQEILKWLKTHPDGVVMTAHHAEDLLETRLLRLIRGTGPQGLQSMSVWKPPFFRPFLETSRFQLRQFLNDFDHQWIEDPSNKKTRYLRNWIRHRWLPALEKRKSGSVKRLSLSLENLIPERLNSRVSSDEGRDFSGIKDFKVLRSDYQLMTPKQQIETLAHLLRSQGIREFSLGQLKEIQKRLDNSQKRLTFKVANGLWTVNAERISVSNVMNKSS